jgi:hypothetical protein
MPRYFFDVQADGVAAEDEYGEELPSVQVAKEAALEFAAELAAARFRPQGDGPFEIRVRDEGGRLVCKVAASLRVEMDRSP